MNYLSCVFDVMTIIRNFLKKWSNEIRFCYLIIVEFAGDVFLTTRLRVKTNLQA